MRHVVAFGRFWWDFIVGDEWRIAVVVAVVAILGAVAAAERWADGRALAVGVGGAAIVLTSVVILDGGRRRRGARS